MFAVIVSKNKQYKVKEGDVIDLELLELKAEEKSLTFDQVLLVGEGDNIKVGTPTVTGAQVTAEIVSEIKAPKATAFKFKRRKGYHRTVGHRQRLLRVKITGVKA